MGFPSLRRHQRRAPRRSRLASSLIVAPFDSEQLWTVLSGRLSISCGGSAAALGPGDTVVIPADVERHVTALEDSGAIVCGYRDAIAPVPGEEAPRGTPAWIA